MKFTVSTSVLLDELQTISGAISNNTVLPILEDFLFVIEGKILKIIASDLETFMSSIVEDIEIAEEGTVAIPSRILLETLKALPNQPLDFDIDQDTYQIKIFSSSGNYTLIGEGGEDFPEIPQPEDVSEIAIDSKVMLNAVNKTLFAVSTDELRPAMTGVNVELGEEGTTFVATDAHKLVRYRNLNVTAKEYANFIVPRKAMTLLKNMLSKEKGDVTIAYNATNAFFNLNGTDLVCRLIDARFPDYNAVIPVDNPNIITINREDLAKALRRIAIYSSKSTYQVKLNVTTNKLDLLAEDRDFSNEAQESLTCQYDGEDLGIAFNARFLAEVLGVLDTEEVAIELSTPSRAGVIIPSDTSENEELLMLVMPIMMNN